MVTYVILTIIMLAVIFAVYLGSFRVKENEIGIVKRGVSFKLFGRPAYPEVSLKGEVGYLPEVFLPGYHWKFPFLYKIESGKRTVIRDGEIGLVRAEFGREGEVGVRLPPWVDCNKFQDARQ